MKITPLKVLKASALPIYYGLKRISRRKPKVYQHFISRIGRIFDFLNVYLFWSCYAGGVWFGCVYGFQLGNLVWPGVGTILFPIVGGILGLIGGVILGRAVNIKNLPVLLTNARLLIGAIWGGMKGFGIGMAAGAAMIPFAGPVAPIILGVFGVAVGAVVVGGLAGSGAAFFSKQIIRAWHAATNKHSVNSTNPYKYQVAPPEEVAGKPAAELYKGEYLTKEYPPIGFSLHPLKIKFNLLMALEEKKECKPVTYGQLQTRNYFLEKCYDWKKDNLGTLAVTKFFWTNKERAANKSLNKIIKKLHDFESEEITQNGVFASSLKEIEKDLYYTFPSPSSR